MYDLSGKVALITGAGGELGIGRAICQRLASEGCDLVLNDLETKPYSESGWGGLPALSTEVEALGREALAIAADVTVNRFTVTIDAMWQDTSAGGWWLEVYDAVALGGRSERGRPSLRHSRTRSPEHSATTFEHGAPPHRLAHPAPPRRAPGPPRGRPPSPRGARRRARSRRSGRTSSRASSRPPVAQRL